MFLSNITFKSNAALICRTQNVLSSYRLQVQLSKQSATTYKTAAGIRYPLQEIKQQLHLIGPHALFMRLGFVMILAFMGGGRGKGRRYSGHKTVSIKPKSQLASKCEQLEGLW